MKKFVVSVIAFFISTFSFAEQISSPFLWKAEKDGHVAYLFGAYHMGFSLSDLPGDFKSYIDSSKNFLMELDITSRRKRAIMADGLFSGDRSLDEYLSQDSWNKLVKIVGNEIPEVTLKISKPWFVSFGLLRPTFGGLPSSPSHATQFFNGELLKYADEQGLEIIFLEDFQLQVSVLEALISARELESVIQGFNSVNNQIELEKFYNCYKNGNLTCIEAEIQSMDEMERQLLLVRRNKDWASLIEKFLKSGQTFVAAGVGHMVGEDNLLSLLEERGFSVTRVKF